MGGTKKYRKPKVSGFNRQKIYIISFHVTGEQIVLLYKTNFVLTLFRSIGR